MCDNQQRGFTLIELMIVVAIIAVTAALAVPNMVAARAAANESGAVATLRNILSAQATFQQQSAVDADRDGAGEYGTFGEMSGLVALNLRPGTASPLHLDPPILSSPFGTIDLLGRVTKSGYFYLMYLPDAAGLGLPEVGGGGPDPLIDASKCENLWACYAWPDRQGTTGSRAFFIDYRGELFQTSMEATPYSGANLPAFNAALTGGSMADPIGLGGASNDGNNWRAVK